MQFELLKRHKKINKSCTGGVFMEIKRADDEYDDHDDDYDGDENEPDDD